MFDTICLSEVMVIIMYPRIFLKSVFSGTIAGVDVFAFMFFFGCPVVIYYNVCLVCVCVYILS